MDLKPLPSIVDDESESKLKPKLELEISNSKSYSEVPKEIHHPSHPNHPLYLYKRQGFPPHTCSICSKYITTLGYKCHNTHQCHFNLHLRCASLIPTISHEEHHHLLTLIETNDEKRPCQTCRNVSDSFYARCVPCDINYHLQCGRQQVLPGTTTIYELHNHPLILSYNDEDKVCDVCAEEINPSIDHPQYVHEKAWLMYSCVECGFYSHVRCAIFEIKLDKREKLDHSIHDHVLFLCDEDDKDEASCCVCGNFVCTDDDETVFTYGCNPCSFYIHKSCIDKLPVPEIAHEFHPDHPLTLYWKKDGLNCDACRMKINGFNYRCVDCNFDIGLDCASKNSSIRTDNHLHLLTYFNKMDPNQECEEKCGFYSPDAGFLRCVQCDFSVHLLCSSLPRGIRFNGHLHSLALEDYHIEDDFGEYYCDHCEGLRDPKECAYHCAEGCPYVVEFNCVIDEVLRLLTDGNVEVRKVNRHAVDEYHFRMVTKGIYLHDVYKSSKEEELELNALKTTTQMELETIMDDRNHHFLHSSFSFFSSEVIKHARKKWWDTPLLPADLNSEVVKIGNYIITKDLQTVFSKIHRKYPDIGDKCRLSEGTKTIVVIQFVQVIREMIETRIVNITKEVFMSWLLRLLFVRQAGFEVDFVFEHMNKVGAVHLGVYNDLDGFPELRDYLKEMLIFTEYIDMWKAKVIGLKTEEKERTNFEFDGGSKETRLRLLSNIDLVLERTDEGLF